jgi:hypothetical protein
MDRTGWVPAGGGGDDPVADDAVHPAVLRWLAAYARAAPGQADAVVAGILKDLDAALKRLEGQVAERNSRLLPPDPHRLDRDRDGMGCGR